MNKRISTLLGVAILLLVVILVVVIYDLHITKQLAQGGVLVGTVGEQALTGQQLPKEIIRPSDSTATTAVRSDAFDPQTRQGKAQVKERAARQDQQFTQHRQNLEKRETTQPPTKK